MSILNQTYFDQHGARRKMIADDKSKTMTYQDLCGKFFDLLNEARDAGMFVDDVMAAVGVTYERTKYEYALAIRESITKRETQ